jgi:hypothetical protein
MAARPTSTKEAKHVIRKFKTPKYKTLRLGKRIKLPYKKLPSVWKLARQSVIQLTVQPRPIIGITLVYVLLLMIFVRGLSGGLNTAELKANLKVLFGSGNNLGNSIAVFSLLLGSSSASRGDIGGLYQTIIIIVVSLALIWALRQILANPKQRVRTKEAFYNGMYPLIPFLLVLLVMSLQLIPVAIANMLYSFVVIGGFAASSIELALWYIMIFLLMLLTLYMLSSSIFALFIVTLPDVRPMQALRAARELVRYRRWSVMRKVILLPLILILLLAIVTLPSILLVPALSEWIFFIATVLLLPLLISYMYGLYRALL